MDAKPLEYISPTIKHKSIPQLSQQIKTSNMLQLLKNNKTKLIQVPNIPSMKFNTTTNQQASKNNIFSKEKVILNKTIKQQDSYPKNVNEFQHFIKDLNLMIPDIAWSFGMRNHKLNSTKTLAQKNNDNNDNNHSKKKVNNNNPPSFYEDDLKKYKGKNLPRNSSAMNITHKGNWFGVDHLTKASNGYTATLNLFNFQTTLRDVYAKNKGYVNPNEWKTSRYDLKKRPQSSCPIPLKLKEANAFVKIDKYSIKPYTKVIDTLEVGKDMIKRKKYVIDKNSLYDFEGRHLSSLPYTEDYGVKNITPINFMLSNHQKGHTQVLFELGMRVYDDNKKNKIEKDERIKEQRQAESASRAKYAATRQRFQC